MEIQGKVIQIMPAAKGTSARGEWQRQEVIFEYADGQYSRKLAVSFFNKPTDIENLKIGEIYNVSFNIESREYNNRWYTELRAWRVTVLEITSPESSSSPFAEELSDVDPF
ncbi:MAG: DUF3127 domain-containing protein [Rikenellaceae bacterium]